MKKKAIYRILLVSCSVFLALGFCELLARLVLPAPPRVIRLSDNAGSVGSAIHSDKTNYTLPHHPEQGFVYVTTPRGRRLRPNAHAVIENHALSKRRIEIETNSLGYRNREIGAKRGTRILFLGDSITFADYLPEEQTFVRLVETLARRDSREWETINAGVGGISLNSEIAILLETGIQLAPDAVVLCFYLNDFHESPGVCLSKVPKPLAWSRLVTHLWLRIHIRLTSKSAHDLALWQQDFERSVENGDDREAHQKVFTCQVIKYFADWGGSWSPYAWKHMQPLFEKLKSLADEHQFRLFVVVFPVSCQVGTDSPDDYPQHQIKSVMQLLDVPVLDILPLLRHAHASGARHLFYDQCHHTPEASQLIASEIYRFLSTHLAVDDTGHNKELVATR